MGRNSALQRLLAVEEEAGLWERRLFGQQIWPMLRIRRYREEYLAGEAARSTTAPPVGQRTAGNLERAWSSGLEFLSGGPGSRPERDLWVLSWSGYRRADAQGQLQCIFAEDLRQQLGDRLLFLEFNNGGLPAQKRPDLLFCDLPQRVSLWRARLAAELLGRLPGLARPWGGDFPSVLLYERALYARSLAARARRWIAQARPRAVFVVCGYGLWLPVQEVLKEEGIPVIELQHGIIHGSHPGYILDSPASSPLGQPDHLVVFGRSFGELLDRESPPWRGKWSVGGHRWLLRSLEGTVERHRRLVFFSQYDTPVQEQIARSAAEMVDRLAPEWEVWIKPHPAEIDPATTYREAVKKGARVLAPRDDTYEVLKSAQAAVSVHSTVAIEALAAGCRSALLPSPQRTDALEALVAEGLLADVAGDDELERWCLRDEEATQGSVARDVFGAGEPPLDFSELIEKLS